MVDALMGVVTHTRRMHPQKMKCGNTLFYAKYPMEGVENVGVPRGYFDSLNMYCWMDFDVKSDVTPL